MQTFTPFALVWALLSVPCRAIVKLRCGQERCGLFSVVMHSGTANTNNCREVCVWLPLLASGLTCGGCGTVGGSIPNGPRPTPTATPPTPTANPPPTPTAPTIPNTGPVVPNPSSAFAIQLDLAGIPSSDVTVFTNAAARWSTVITSDLVGGSTSGFRALPGCTYPADIDDLYICGRYRFIDGAGRILGSAGPYYTRTRGGLPIVGSMEFDSADVAALRASGGIYGTILHEMGHVIGIGTLWNEQGAAGPDAANCPYTGSNANREYQAVSGCSAVPTEQDGGSGTACGHWDEQCLLNELMTGFLTRGTTASLSRITVASLLDLGYAVDLTRADAYSSADLAPGCTCRRRRTMMEMVHGETFPLGLRNGVAASTLPSPRRRLSNEAHDLAMETGRSILQQRAQLQLTAKSKAVKLPSNVTFVGDQVVSIMVQDGDEVYGVIVRMDN